MSQLSWAALMSLGLLSLPLQAQPQSQGERLAASSPHFSLECQAESCLIRSDELSFEIISHDNALVIKPRTFKANPTGPLASYGIIEPSQFIVVPDYLWPREGHYLIGQSETVIEWLHERDTVSNITLNEFLVQARRSKFLYITVMKLVSRDSIKADTRKIETAPILEAIRAARVQLGHND